MTAAPGAILVAHGQPSDPEPADAALRDLATRVAAHLPGWRVAGATLALPDALGRALAATGAAPLVYPVFMAEGWFTRTALPRRLAEAGAGDAAILPALGSDPALHRLAADRTRAAARAEGWAPEDTALILAAHGSRVASGSARATLAVAEVLRAAGPWRDLRLGFIEEPPFVADSAWGAGDRALCLPLFAASGGHVTDDLPAALAEAGFAGRLMPPIGTDTAVPGLIAAALRAAG